MDKDLYEVTSPALNQDKPKKEGNFFTRFLVNHPRMILPLTGMTYVIYMSAMMALVVFINR